jgi:hypothetical protein
LGYATESVRCPIRKKPPTDFPAFDFAKPDTDFQLQEALVIARAMVAARESKATR